MALDVEGRCYTWGRNEVLFKSRQQFFFVHRLIFMVLQKGQLGHGDTHATLLEMPRIVSGLSK